MYKYIITVDAHPKSAFSKKLLLSQMYLYGQILGQRVHRLCYISIVQTCLLGTVQTGFTAFRLELIGS